MTFPPGNVACKRTRKATPTHPFLVAMNAVGLDLAGSNFRQTQMTEERHCGNDPRPSRGSALGFATAFS
jgi:hypothetical protein